MAELWANRIPVKPLNLLGDMMYCLCREDGTVMLFQQRVDCNFFYPVNKELTDMYGRQRSAGGQASERVYNSSLFTFL